jgi:hypothetical protein
MLHSHLSSWAIGGAPRRPVVKPKPGVLPPNAVHVQADYFTSAPLSSWRIKALSGIEKKKSESGDGTAAYRAASWFISRISGAERRLCAQ